LPTAGVLGMQASFLSVLQACSIAAARMHAVHAAGINNSGVPVVGGQRNVCIVATGSCVLLSTAKPEEDILQAFFFFSTRPL